MSNSGLERLLRAVVIRAVQDYRDDEFRRDVQDFLKSEYFEAMADAVDLDPYMVRAKTVTGQINTDCIRAAYR